jgi:hypothetical protein
VISLNVDPSALLDRVLRFELAPPTKGAVLHCQARPSASHRQQGSVFEELENVKCSLTLLTLRHSQISIFLVWAPSDDTLPGYTLARDTALVASWNTPPDGMDHIQSAAFQKDRARKKAFTNWEREFGLEHCLAQFRLRWTGESGKGHAF